MTRDEAWDLLQAEYGLATLDDDPEWTTEMIDILIDDPEFLAR